MTQAPFSRKASLAIVAAVGFTVAEKTLPDVAVWVENWLHGSEREVSDAGPIATGVVSLLSIALITRAASTSEDKAKDTVAAIWTVIILCLYALVKDGVTDSGHPFHNANLIAPLSIWGTAALVFLGVTVFASKKSYKLLFQVYFMIVMAGVFGLTIGLGYQFTIEAWLDSQKAASEGVNAANFNVKHIVTPGAAVALAAPLGLLAYRNIPSNLTFRGWGVVLGLGTVIALAHGWIEGGDDWVTDLGLSRVRVVLMSPALTLPALLAAALVYRYRSTAMPFFTMILVVSTTLLAAFAAHLLLSPWAGDDDGGLRRTHLILSTVILPILSMLAASAALFIDRRMPLGPAKTGDTS